MRRFTGALVLDPAFPEALLNRANARLSLQDWEGAGFGLSVRIKLPPWSTHRKIRFDQVLALLDQTVVDTAPGRGASKLAEETRKKQADEAKRVADVAAEAERQKAEAEAASLKTSRRGRRCPGKTKARGSFG